MSKDCLVPHIGKCPYTSDNGKEPPYLCLAAGCSVTQDPENNEIIAAQLGPIKGAEYWWSVGNDGYGK
jgi:hypothetical protein